MPSARQLLGRWGEETALSYLQAHGHTLQARNYRCRYGEVDLITRQADDLVFVEVKTRRSNRYGPPELAITARKQQHLLQTAQHYLLAHDLDEHPWRIDVVTVWRGPNDRTRIEVFENAVSG